MLIPQDKIDDILDTARIVDVISDYMTLRKKGSNYLGTCPFHHERTPSFSVNPNKQIWKCFSCGKGGNVLQFLMEKESMSFPEAVMTLAKKYNIEIEVNAMSEEERRKSLLRESEFNILKLASAEFEYNLNNTPAALEYLGSRSIDEEIIRKFGIGFAGNGNSLSSGFLKKGYKSELLISTGLAGNGERGLYDYFRSRIIFPFFNLQGKVIGFTGRITDNDIKTAKYLNSPETNLFDKGSALFGLYQAKASIGHMNRCYLVEGQFDVLSFVNAGVENTIAGSGTALTPKQVILINKFTKNVTLIYDNDAAGQKATMKNIEALVSAGSIVRVVTLPDGKDPDDFAKSYNGDLRIYLANHETGFVDYLFSKLKSEDVAIMNESLNKILSVISSFPEQSLRDSYIKHLADISETTFDDLIRRTRNLKKNASQIEVTELPDGIYGVDEAKECLEQKDDAFLLSNNFELFTDYLSIEPVVYLKGIPSVSDIQSLRSLSKYIEIENPRIHITEKRECDYLLSIKEIYKAGFSITINAEESAYTFIDFYIKQYSNLIKDNITDSVDEYVLRAVEMISFAPSTTRTRKLKAWASELYLPNEKSLKDLLKPFLDRRKNKKEQEREQFDSEVDLLSIDTDILPEYVESDETLMKIYRRFGFYPLLNKNGDPVAYMFRTDGNSHVRISDFYMEPLLHIYDSDKEYNKRVLKLNRLYVNKPKFVEWKSSIFANMSSFNEMLINEGAFNFENGEVKHFKKIWQFMSYEFQTCRELKVFGQQNENFFAFSNAIFHEVNGEYRIDHVSPLGVVEHNGENYYSPAFSEIYAGERKDSDKYAQDRWLVYTDVPENKRVSFEKWADLMDKVYAVNDNGKWALIYAIMCAFRSDIYPIDRLFTSIFFIGPTMSGKTQIAIAIRSLFIKPDAPSFNLNSGTDAAFFSVLERFRDVPQIMEEYNDDQISDQKFQGLKSVTYDGDGKQKRKSTSGNDIETSQVNAPVILLGQEAPQKDDNALSNRVVLCEVPKTESWSQEAQALFQELKDVQRNGLSNILFEILKLRSLFKNKFMSIQRGCSKQLQDAMASSTTKSGDQTRVINTISLFMATCKLLEIHAPHLKLPFTYQEFFELGLGKIRSQVEMISRTDKLSVFFNSIDYLIDKGAIKPGRDFKIDMPGKVTLKNQGERILQPADTRVLYMNLSNIHKMYSSSVSGDKPLTLATLELNLKSHPAFIGAVTNTRFKWTEVREIARGGITSNESGDAIANNDMKRVVENFQKSTSAIVLNYDVLQRFMGIDFEREMIKIPIDNDNVVDEKPF